MTEALAIHVDAPLIDGEDPGTMRAADARRWIEIYSRLIEFKDELLERVRTRTSENGDGSRGDLQADEQVVLVEMARLRGRLAFWQRRHAELAPVDLDDRLGIISPTGDVVPSPAGRTSCSASCFRTPDGTSTPGPSPPRPGTIPAWPPSRCGPTSSGSAAGCARRR